MYIYIYICIYDGSYIIISYEGRETFVRSRLRSPRRPRVGEERVQPELPGPAVSWRPNRG